MGSQRTIQTLEDMLMVCILDLKVGWEEHLPLIEFSYNNSYQVTIGMAPFEATWEREDDIREHHPQLFSNDEVLISEDWNSRKEGVVWDPGCFNPCVSLEFAYLGIKRVISSPYNLVGYFNNNAQGIN